MKRVFKIILIVGCVLILVGGAMFCTALAMADWDITALSGTRVEELRYTEPAGASFDRVELVFGNADVNIQFSDEVNALSIAYPQMVNRVGEPVTELTVTEAENGVTIHEKTLFHKQIFSLFNFSDPKVTVLLPRERSYSLTVFTGNGAISLDTGSKEQGHAMTESVHLDTGNGRIDLADSSHVTCNGHFSAHTDNGAIQLGTVTAASLYAESGNGEITVTGGRVAGEVQLLSDNGRIQVLGDLTAGKIFAESDNGRITFAGNLTAGEIEVESDNGKLDLFGRLDAPIVVLSSDNGDIRAHVAGVRSEYSIDCKVGNGKSNVANQSAEQGSASFRVLRVKSDNGDVEIQFIGTLMAGQ